MKTLLEFVLLLIACVVTWGISVGSFVYFFPDPVRSRLLPLSILIVSIPALFAVAMGFVANKNGATLRIGWRLGYCATWVAAFALACWAAAPYVIVPAYFFVGGKE